MSMDKETRDWPPAESLTLSPGDSVILLVEDEPELSYRHVEVVSVHARGGWVPRIVARNAVSLA